jgi:hypothetical protein
MGDRWESSDLATSTYIWLPLTLSGTSATLVIRPFPSFTFHFPPSRSPRLTIMIAQRSKLDPQPLRRHLDNRPIRNRPRSRIQHLHPHQRGKNRIMFWLLRWLRGRLHRRFFRRDPHIPLRPIKHRRRNHNPYPFHER